MAPKAIVYEIKQPAGLVLLTNAVQSLDACGYAPTNTIVSNGVYNPLVSLTANINFSVQTTNLAAKGVYLVGIRVVLDNQSYGAAANTVKDFTDLV